MRSHTRSQTAMYSAYVADSAIHLDNELFVLMIATPFARVSWPFLENLVSVSAAQSESTDASNCGLIGGYTNVFLNTPRRYFAQ